MSSPPLDQVRPAIRAMAGYTPGEQPADGQKVVKLNTNENPFPPPPRVFAALQAALDERLRLYPEPGSRPVREAAARAYGVAADAVLVGNGSDDILTILMRTFVDPGDTVLALRPSYSLYEPLTTLQGGRYEECPWGNAGALPVEDLAARNAKLILITRPNAPTGHATPLEAVAQLCQRTRAIVLLDEAYADFADDNGLPLLSRHPNLVISRSFSKSLCLAGLRLGLCFADAQLVREMHKVRDSYNVDRLAQAAAVAALDHREDFAPLVAAIRHQRQRLTWELRQRAFDVIDSQANFIFAHIPPGRRDGPGWVAGLKARGVLVRHFTHDPELLPWLRITIGTPEQLDRLLEEVDHLRADNT
ncbi:MAG: histidinol-phosphate transaminase [Magnetococcus sp. WYHC-3]